MSNRDIAVELSAQMWCKPKTKHLVMIPELAFEFAKILEPMMNRLDKLLALENFGVDNWSGYGDAMEWLAEQRSI